MCYCNVQMVMTTEQRKKKALEWQEYDEIAEAVDFVKKQGRGDVVLTYTDSRLTYINIEFRKLVKRVAD